MINIPILKAYRKLEGKQKNLEIIKEFTPKMAQGYECLATEYTDAITKMKFKCNDGHIFYKKWNKFKSGERCPKCNKLYRYSFDEIVHEINAREPDYQCVSNGYVNAHTKLNFICNNRHPFSMTWASFQQGHRCPKCSQDRRNNLLRFALEEVKKIIKEIEPAYELVSTEYVNTHSPLELRCNKGHQFRATLHNFKDNNSRCPDCWGERRGEIQKLTLEEVKARVKDLEPNYCLISTEYIDAHTKLEFKCDEGHPFFMQWGNFQQGQRCPECFGNKAHTLDSIKVGLRQAKISYQLISEEYVNLKTKLLFLCKENHLFSMRLDHIRNGHGCPECARERIASFHRFTLDDVKKLTKELEPDYECVASEYTNTVTKIEFICNRGHEFKTEWNTFRNGVRCRVCYREKIFNPLQRLGDYLRGNISSWQVESKQFYNNRCIITGETENIALHHKYPFKKIVYETIENLGLPVYETVGEYSDYYLDLIVNECLRLHFHYGYGVPLKVDLHIKFHRQFGIREFTLEDFELFAREQTLLYGQ